MGFACLVSLVDGLGFGLANSVVSSESGSFRCGYVVMLSYLWVWFAYAWCCVVVDCYAFAGFECGCGCGFVFSDFGRYSSPLFAC